MPYDDDNDRSTLSTTTTSVYTPVTIDKQPLSWDGNDAGILGLLYEAGRYYKAKGLFQTLLKYRAVAVGTKLAMEDTNTVFLANKSIVTSYGFDKPAPPTRTVFNTLLAEHNTESGRAEAAGEPFSPAIERDQINKIPSDCSHNYVVMPHAVEIEDSKLLSSLMEVFGGVDAVSGDLEIEADGSGTALLGILRERAKNATPRDKALIASKLAAIIRDGVRGDLTTSTFAEFLKAYRAALRNVPEKQRPSDDAEVEMISVIAIRDGDSRDLYELKAARCPCRPAPTPSS